MLRHQSWLRASPLAIVAAVIGDPEEIESAHLDRVAVGAVHRSVEIDPAEREIGVTVEIAEEEVILLAGDTFRSETGLGLAVALGFICPGLRVPFLAIAEVGRVN